MVNQDQSNTITVNFAVNGVDRNIRIDPRYSLADVLRDQLRLTGLHLGCEQGVCGACAVLIDGEPAVSCLTLAAQVDGANIETVEHIAGSGPDLGKLQRSFIKHGAFQCGFCTPGFLIMGHYLVKAGMAGDRETVRRNLSGNICRCTGYESIIDAIVAVGAGADGDE
jgi:carbon-monoxide dehydrogenase small subunit